MNRWAESILVLRNYLNNGCCTDAERKSVKEAIRVLEMNGGGPVVAINSFIERDDRGIPGGPR